MRARLALLLVVSACAPRRETRCLELKAEAAACFGDQLPDDACADLSEGDLENLTRLARDLDCSGRGSVVPIDGDFLSSSCRLTGLGCARPINPEPSYQPARLPIILVNGIDVSPLFRWDQRIVEMMSGLGGQRIFLAVDTPYETPRRRARDLWARIQEVQAQTGAEQVNLICHSLGGLDCRYLVSPGGLHGDLSVAEDEIARAVASITTVGTAHHGTRIADVALGYLPDGEDLDAIERLASLLGDAFTADALAHDVHLRESIQALSTAEAIAFNAEVPDVPAIYYQSWAGFSAPYGVAPLGYDELLSQVCKPDQGGSGLETFRGNHDHMALPLIPGADVVGADDPAHPGWNVPNDGLTTVTSARWGNFRGCLPADHMEQLGRLEIPAVNVRTGFDVARFYTELAGDLAARGF